MLAKACLPKVTGRSVFFLAMAGLALLAPGCDQLDMLGTDPGAEIPAVAPENRPSPESRALKAYYARVEQGHRTRGLLRADGGGPDVPFDGERLAATFETTAFAREFTDLGAALVRREAASMLHRWGGPVLIEVVFGASVPDMQRADDRASVARYAERLGQITRHPVRFVEKGGNFQVLILSEEERRVVGPLLTRAIPGIRAREIDVIQTLDRATYCVVVASDPGDDGNLTRAVAVIRAELPPLLRLSCIHEEIAQGLGLANDSDRARPSIFNDDDEFGRLTAMDELMLRMLYDIRLQPGMSADTARPIVRDLAAGLTGPAL